MTTQTQLQVPRNSNPAELGNVSASLGKVSGFFRPCIHPNPLYN